jgi:uncharacterized protein
MKAAIIAFWALAALSARADGALHSLFELHGKHNTVYVLGSIHTLRAGDYPLAPAVMDAYKNSKALVMEINLDQIDSAQMQAEMLSSAMLPDGKSLPEVMGPDRYSHAQSLAHDVGFELSTHDQLSIFEGMSMATQAEYLMSSLEQAHDLPKVVDGMVRAWQRGDMDWFETELKSDLGRDPAVYQSVLVARNRKWISRIEAMLNDDKNYLVIVGTAHLVGRDGVIDLLKKDGFPAAQL